MDGWMDVRMDCYYGGIGVFVVGLLSVRASSCKSNAYDLPRLSCAGSGFVILLVIMLVVALMVPVMYVIFLVFLVICTLVLVVSTSTTKNGIDHEPTPSAHPSSHSFSPKVPIVAWGPIMGFYSNYRMA